MEVSILDSILPLLTLLFLEVILGIDNIIFISIIADKLPDNQRDKLRLLGLGLAMIMRLLLLLAISWIMKLDRPLITVSLFEFTGKELILLAGGIFLLYKSIKEIYHETEHKSEIVEKAPPQSFNSMLLQVIALDLVFSVDSIITAVGMTEKLWIMYLAVILSMSIMMLASKPIVDFIRKHPSFKILALAFLVVIGTTLVAEGFNYPIPKPFIYSSLAFALLVDLLQIRTQKSKKQS
ncbi:MAG: TerC family protein [Saprospiraceae bacterium]|nr:TerC family protein [Saprospiraceae bacterium]